MIEFIKLYEITLTSLVWHRATSNCINWVYPFRSSFKGFLERLMAGCLNSLTNDTITGRDISFFFLTPIIKFLFHLCLLTVCPSSIVWIFRHYIVTVSNQIFRFGNYSLQYMQYLFRWSHICLFLFYTYKSS